MEDPSRPAATTATGYPAAQPYPAAQHSSYPNGYPRPANGYPYPAQPTQTQNVAYYYNNTNSSNYAHAVCLRRFFAVLLTLIILLVTISFIMWLVIRPRVPEFRIDSASVTNLSLPSSTQLTGNWQFNFTVRNPNKKVSVHYDQIESSLRYKDAFISDTVMQPFGQGTQSDTQLRASFSASGSYVDGKAAGDLGKDKEKGSVGFDVRILARVRLDAGFWKARRRVLRVLCEDVRVGGFTNGSDSGNLSGGAKECKVGV